jgi:quercetin dioxygenase-like cupin family protein
VPEYQEVAKGQAARGTKSRNVKLVVAGFDARGRSTVIERRELFVEKPQAGRAHDFLHRTDGRPLQLEISSSAAAIEAAATGIPARGSAWIAVAHSPNATTHLHRTDSIDYGVVASGEMTLALEDGSEELEVGDVVLVLGAPHAWHAGPRGCTMVIALLEATTSPATTEVPSS